MPTAGDSEEQDPIKTDSDKYTVLLEKEWVRVLDYCDKPGEKTAIHRHPAFILYALCPFKRRLIFADGRTLIREFKSGDVIWMEAQTHIGENIGETDSHALIIERK